MGEEGKERRMGKDPQYLKCVDAHANLPIIKQLLLTFWHSGALCTRVPERQRLITRTVLSPGNRAKPCKFRYV